MAVPTSAGSEWTERRRGRGRKRPEVVDVDAVPRPVTEVAFDQFVIDAKGLLAADGSALIRGTAPDGSHVAVGSTPWPGMPIEWVALQSRRAPDVLGLDGDEMAPAGHRRFDQRFAVDADDVSAFRKLFRTTLRDWLVDFDDAHGPLIVIFDGPPDLATPRRRTSDPPADDPPATDDADGFDPASVPTVFLARVVDDDAQVVETLALAAELAAHVRTTLAS